MADLRTDVASGRASGAPPARAASTDPRAERVRAALLQAGFDLLMERPIAEISVPDLVARAQVSRPVFYRHFADRDDLIVATVVQRMDDAVRDATDAADATRRVLTWAGQYRELYANVHPSFAAQQLSGHLREIIRPWCRELVASADLTGAAPDRGDTERFLVGGILELVRAAVSTSPPKLLDARTVMRLTAALVS